MLHIIMSFGCVGIQNFGVTPKSCSYPHNALFRRLELSIDSHWLEPLERQQPLERQPLELSIDSHWSHKNDSHHWSHWKDSHHWSWSHWNDSHRS